MLEEKYNKLINFFKDISKIPRNSGSEEQIADFLCDFAKERNLYYRKDKYNNVLIKKDGINNKKTILFQAHTDMVCTKINNSKHDFTKDQIEIIEDKNTLHAKDTTLGADDGIGVAFLMLLLDDREIESPIECLFTTSEETGMNGAKEFDYSDINASYLINLDGEEENTAIVGCAGGITLEYTKDLKQKKVTDDIYSLSISNLYGGHSGVDIAKDRMNSNLLAATLLKALENIKIISFIGGSKDNAIANNTKVIFTTPTKNIKDIINKKLSEITFTKEDSTLEVSCEKIENKNYKSISTKESKNIITLITNLKQNVIEYNKYIKESPEVSGNIGVVKIENGKCLIKESLRSNDDSKKEKYKEENNNLATSLNFSIEESSDYPGWIYNPISKLRDKYISSYKKFHNSEEPILCDIHAGVECGIIYKKLPHLDMISIGPDIKDVHTPNETLYLDSCKSLLETLLDLINNLD